MKSLDERIEEFKDVINRIDDCIIQIRLANIWDVDFDMNLYYECLNTEYNRNNCSDIIKNIYPTINDDWLDEIIPVEYGSGLSFRFATPIKST